ncbi:MAG: MFS transporter [Verrucomicrobia bacterium]|nr:MFS transporter [Verrucomicrobiota bacterium]MBS0637438.1 MFS transporter [Verrucomicrobiota bacterium]
MLAKLTALFAPAPHLPVTEDSEAVAKSYRSWRIRTLYSMFIGYALYYFTRKSYSLAMPGIITDLGYTKAELGILGSIIAISYGFSKFFSGILSDKSSPRYFMAFGLITTGIINIIFGMASSLIVFAFLWGLNGWFQGFGWPACSRLLVSWYSKSERGSWWSTWNVCHNVGAFSIAVLAGFLVQHFGWRSGMYVPGLICIAGGFFMVNRLRDTPQAVGLPPIDVYRNDVVPSPVKEATTSSTWDTLVTHVFTNRYLWLLGIAYFFVYFARTAMNDWTPMYLIETRNYSLIQANSMATMIEIGGFFGNLAAGWASDRLFGARRGPVNVLFSLGMVLGILLFSIVPVGAAWQESATLALIGFMIFGPQMLIGVAAVELAHKSAIATSSGFVSCISYMGAAAAGYPLGIIIQEFGWSGHFSTIIGASIMAVLFLLPLWAAKERPVTLAAASA